MARENSHDIHNIERLERYNCTTFATETSGIGGISNLLGTFQLIETRNRHN